MRGQVFTFATVNCVIIVIIVIQEVVLVHKGITGTNMYARYAPCFGLLDVQWLLFQGTELLFTDFGNFPVFFIESKDFDNAVEVLYGRIFNLGN